MLQLGRAESDKSKMKRMLSVSQPQLDTNDVFDIPSPPPVATKRFESSFSAVNRPPLPPPPPPSFGHPDAPDEAPKAQIATIPELQMDAASEENVSARESVLQSSLMTPAATAQAGDESVPVCPADLPQVDLDAWGHGGAVVGSAMSTISQQDSVHQDSAPAECIRGKPSDDQPETPGAVTGPFTAGVNATVDAEPPHHAAVPRPEADPASTPSPAVRPQKTPGLANPDQVYGALYDSLFPQSFTSEVLSSLSTPPPQVYSAAQRSQTVVRTIDQYRAEHTAPGLPAAGGREDPMDLYVDRISVSGGSTRTSCQSGAETNGGPDLQSSVPPSSLYATSGTRTQAEPAHNPPEGKLQPFNLKEDTPNTGLLLISAPPIFDHETAPGTEARFTDSVPTVTPVRDAVKDQVSSRTLCPSTVPHKKHARTPPGDMEGFLSPTYLSVGSEDSSVVDIYYSAEEDNEDSGDDEMYVSDEGGVQMGAGGETGGVHGELWQRGGVAWRDDGISQETSVKNSGEEEKDDARLPDEGRFLEVMEQVKEEGKERREETFLAKPVQQVNKLMVCDFSPPSTETRRQPEDSQEIWASRVETGDPPSSERLSFSQPPLYLTRRQSYDPRQEVALTSHRAASAATDTVASMTHGGSAPEHNRLPQSAEWVDTITASRGRVRNQAAALRLTDAQRTDTSAPPGGPERPAGAQLEPCSG